ncbi:hypothetical protein BU25DRAFT_419297 [Macroventuria anomochaeta]|uniref:Uncharacterized protein n=1 Tax=Macroventuria anomochaeta TaxID=301207 RepID=A0ACB6S9M3_9PLEO|nr:uncharacterized protein BU25DRAFT_419297 [Macroventuria anomochaeta]KAF2630280.1 hypothetical protein BU25DRAFT_419297 [Macroventuria anomochaeta]
MFPPPWGRDSMPDFHYLLNHRSRHRPTYPAHHSLSPPLDPHGMHYHHGPKPTYPKTYKQARFSDLGTPSSSDFSSSEFEGSYAFDFDNDDDVDKHRVPSYSPLRRYARSPELRRTSVMLPSDTAEKLCPDEVLFLPSLTHLHIRIRSAYTRDEDIRAAVPSSMAWRDLVQQVVDTYIGGNVRSNDVKAFVKQRGRWDSPSSGITMEDLGDRGEVFWEEGRKGLHVKIEVGDNKERERISARFGGKSSRGGGVDVEKVWERTESRVRAGVRG